MRFSITDHTGHTETLVDTRTEDGAKLAQEMLDKLVAEHRIIAVRALGGSGSGGDFSLVRPADGRVDAGSLDPDSEVLGSRQLKGG